VTNKSHGKLQYQVINHIRLDNSKQESKVLARRSG